jgi:hypothetical protein
LPLFQEADRREAAIKPEHIEQVVELPLTACWKVVEDFRKQQRLP